MVEDTAQPNGKLQGTGADCSIVMSDHQDSIRKICGVSRVTNLQMQGQIENHIAVRTSMVKRIVLNHQGNDLIQEKSNHRGAAVMGLT